MHAPDDRDTATRAGEDGRITWITGDERPGPRQTIGVLEMKADGSCRAAFAERTQVDGRCHVLLARQAWGPCHIDWSWPRFDFRVGGEETGRGGPAGGPVYTVVARYHDIVPGRRIVYTYDMARVDTRVSISLVSIDLIAEDGGTRLVWTEAGVFLDGQDGPDGREMGTGEGLDRLGEILSQATAGV